jgi:serine/threonine protein kinase
MPPFDPPLSDAEIAPQFPEYTCEGIIKTGGQGSVFKMKHPENGECALKVTAPVFYERVERETEVLKSIDDPTMYKLIDYGHFQIRGQLCPYTITVFIEGDDLQSVLRSEGAINEDRVKKILVSVCTALNIMWRKRIVHRDIKPDNIMIRNDRSAVLIDLAIARLVDRTSLTLDGHWLGTPGYMSPEQAKAVKTLTVKSDVFALGIIGYQALTGQHPFAQNQVLIQNNIPVLPAINISSCSQQLSDTLGRMFQHRPVLRPSPTEILRLFNSEE